MLKSTLLKLAPRRPFLVKCCVFALALAGFAPAQTESAVANGDTRTITLYHSHTGESISATFRVNGAYDLATLEKLNYFLRDWRNNEPTKMDPRLFDAVWETYRESGSQEPIVILSAYRSPETNAMLRSRSRLVAEFSQHMLGKAMDMHYTDVPMSRVREIAMHLQRGGVGYYPTSGSPFVHMDVGGVRAWPRMSRAQLVNLFPDGKTVHIPADGQPLARYEEARAEVEARNGVSLPTVAQVKSKGFFAMLFGGGDEEETVAVAPSGAGPRPGGSSRVAEFIERSRYTNAATRLASAGAYNRPGAPPAAVADDTSPAAFFLTEAARRAPSENAAPAPVAPPVAAAPPQLLKPTVLPETAPATVAAAAPVDANPVEPPGAPMPPRRPTQLALNAAAPPVAPLPPVRPGNLVASLDGARAAPAALPNVITTGGAAPVIASMGALAYAGAVPGIGAGATNPAPKPVLTRSIAAASRNPGLRSDVASGAPAEPAARLDRANFRILTSPATIANADPAALAPTITGLRRARRSDVSALIFSTPIGGTDSFSGAAPLERRAGLYETVAVSGVN